jgi:uncharacterized protein YndB with AHSA1/START domain
MGKFDNFCKFLKMKNETRANKFTIVREFEASPEEVFDAFSNGNSLSQWYGPAGFTTTVLTLDFKPGGIFHYCMQQGDYKMYGKFVFKRIEKPTLLELTNSFADETGTIVKAPFDIEIPKEILYTYQFEEKKGHTVMTMTGQPINANDKEITGFNSIEESMHQGFNASFDQLQKHLSGH